MAVDTTRGAHGQPIIIPGPRTVGDMQDIADYAGAVGTRVIVGTYAEMTTGFVTKFGFAPYDGLECFNTDSGETNIWNAATNTWEPYDPPGATVGAGTFTPSSGWSNDGGSQFMTIGHGFCQVYASFKRTGGAIAVPADGNVGGTVTVGTLAIPARQTSGLGSGSAGRMSAFQVSNTGLVTLSATTPGGSIATGDYLSFAGLYMI